MSPTYQTLWGPLYETVLGILGATGTLLPFSDSLHGQPDAATFKSLGDEQVAFTWSKSIDTWDETFDPRLDRSFQGIVPRLRFDGVDQEADSPDAAFWTPNPDTISVGAWVRMADATDSDILTRWDLTTGTLVREWRLGINSSDQPFFHVYDETNNAQLGRLDATTIVENQWNFLVGTGGGGTTAATLNLYLNGAVVDDTDDNAGSGFSAIVDTAAVTRLGFSQGASAGVQFFDGFMAGGPLAPFYFPGELTADQVLRLYEIGRRALAL